MSSTSGEVVRMGIIGCGRNMDGHVRRLLQNPEVRIVGLADPNRESLTQLMARNPGIAKVPTFVSCQDMLAAVQPQAVEISTPHTLHYEQIMDSLSAGCHVLTEKPMVCEISHAREVVRRSEEVGKVVLVSYQMLYQAQERAVKKLVENGSLGSIQFVNILLNENWYDLADGTWRSEPKFSGGGFLNDTGSHILAFMLWATDLKADTVHCFQENFDRKVEVNTALSVRFENGALGSLALVGNAPPGWGYEVTIFGSKGSVYLSFSTVGVPEGAWVLEHRSFLQPEPIALGELPADTEPDSNFIDVIHGQDTVHAPATLGLRVIELTTAITQSARIGRPVKVNHGC